MATIKDVALKANVAIATVSRYLNNPNKVSKETAALIKKAILELDYFPSDVARNLKTKNTNTIALIIPSLLMPFYSTIAHYIQEECDIHNYKVLLCNTNGKKDREEAYLKLVREQKADGIIAFTYFSLDEYAKELPLIVFDQKYTGKFSTLASANYDGGKLAAQYLIKTKCKKLAYIGTKENIKHSQVSYRRIGFVDYCKTNNISYLEYIPQDPIVDYELLVNNFFDQVEVDGVFCEDDEIARHLVYTALKRKIKIPKDLSIIGFDGTNSSFYELLKLTTIVQPLKLIANKLVSKLIALINNEEANEDIVLPINLTIGETTRQC